jgi:hypothetical protein
MRSTLPWDLKEFKEIYAEAVEEWRFFHNHAADALRECSAGNDLSAALESYEKANTHYWNAIKLVARISLRFYGGTAGAVFDHTKEAEIQLAALSGMLSRSMNELLSVHKISLRRDQNAKLAALRNGQGAS